MIGARGDYPESGAASDDLAGLIHLSNGPIEHDAWLPSVETGFQLVGSRLSTNRKQINECRPQVTVGRAFQPVKSEQTVHEWGTNKRTRRGYSLIRGQAFVDGSPSNTITAGPDVFPKKNVPHPRAAPCQSK